MQGLIYRDEIRQFDKKIGRIAQQLCIYISMSLYRKGINFFKNRLQKYCGIGIINHDCIPLVAVGVSTPFGRLKLAFADNRETC